MPHGGGKIPDKTKKPPVERFWGFLVPSFSVYWVGWDRLDTVSLISVRLIWRHIATYSAESWSIRHEATP